MPHLSFNSPLGTLTVFEHRGAIVALEWGRAGDPEPSPLLSPVPEQPQRTPLVTMLGALGDYATDRENATAETRRGAAPMVDKIAGRPIARKGNSVRNSDDITDPVRQRRSGRFSKTLDKAKSSAEARNDAIDRQKAIDRRKARIARQKQQKFENLEWDPIPVPLGPGVGGRTFKTTGPVRIRPDTAFFGVDNSRYTVLWHPLDKNGKELRVFKNHPKEQPAFSPGLGVKQFPLIKTYEPPFDSPYGFRVTVHIPPQHETTGASPGPILHISVPKGSLTKDMPAQKK